MAGGDDYGFVAPRQGGAAPLQRRIAAAALSVAATQFWKEAAQCSLVALQNAVHFIDQR
jgi:hypothetical protein